MARHKWNGKVGTSRDMLVVACVKCDMVKQMVGGYPTYFRDDTVWDKLAPPCDERLLNSESTKQQTKESEACES